VVWALSTQPETLSQKRETLGDRESKFELEKTADWVRLLSVAGLDVSESPRVGWVRQRKHSAGIVPQRDVILKVTIPQ
jgi:hypothetical protein